MWLFDESPIVLDQPWADIQLQSAGATAVNYDLFISKYKLCAVNV